MLTKLTEAAGSTGQMNLAPRSLSGITTGWNAFNIQGIKDGKLTAVWWSSDAGAGPYVDTDGTWRQGQDLGLNQNGRVVSRISDAAVPIGSARSTPPASFLAFNESQGNGRTEFDPRPTRFISNGGVSVVVVDYNLRAVAT